MRRGRRIANWLIVAAALAIASPAVSQDQPRSLTKHSIQQGSKIIRYEASAGFLDLTNEKGERQYNIFYTAYRVKNAAKPRPVIFLWNGGPGSSTIWLRMGSFGPKRVRPLEPGVAAGTQLEDNPDTLIGDADLVFLDAPETGYSRAAAGQTTTDYAGVDQDARIMKRAVEHYLDAQMSSERPVYLLGESYGTLRAPVVARMLHEDGIRVDGIILMSCVIGGDDLGSTSDLDYVTWLPTYAAIGAYYHKVPASPAQAAANAERFARSTYAAALFAGSALPIAEQQTVAASLAALTGMPQDYWLAHHLRIDRGLFRRDLLGASELGIGAHDIRASGPDFGSHDVRPNYDASDVPLRERYVEGMRTYFRDDLRFATPLDYRVAAPSVVWDDRHQPPGARRPLQDDDVRPDIALMLREDPRFRVLALSGLFDIVTPYFRTEYDLNHLEVPAITLSRVKHVRLDAGHMLYADPIAAPATTALIRDFLEWGQGREK